MKFSAAQIAQFLGGKVEGDSEVEVSNISKIEEAQEGSLAFLANPKYEKYLYETQASIVLVNNDLELTEEVGTTLIRVPNAYQAFASLLDLVSQARPQKTGVDKSAYVSASAQLGNDLYIGAGAYVGDGAVIGHNVKIYPQAYVGENVTIGDNTILYPGVKVYHDCTIGANCIFHANTVIGSDGFGFAPQSGNDYKKIHHIGNVVIEDNVEVGANATIDRATMGSTLIRKGVKLDNLIQIAHNVEIGERTVIAAQTGVSGSTKIGRDCMIGGQVGFVGHITIADQVKIAAQSGVASSITEKGRILQGAPAIDLRAFLKSYVYFKRLPELAEELKQLQREIKQLSAK